MRLLSYDIPEMKDSIALVEWRTYRTESQVRGELLI